MAATSNIKPDHRPEESEVRRASSKAKSVKMAHADKKAENKRHGKSD